MGVALKSKFPFRAVYADSDGLRLDKRNKLIVMLHCGRIRSHSLDGNLGSHVYNPAIR